MTLAQIDRNVVCCPQCNGTGIVGNYVHYECAICEGKGKIIVEDLETATSIEAEDLETATSIEKEEDAEAKEETESIDDLFLREGIFASIDELVLPQPNLAVEDSVSVLATKPEVSRRGRAKKSV